MLKIRTAMTIAVCALILLTANITQAATFTGLGDLAGGIFYSGANGVSDDGSTVVGNSYSASGLEAFRWTSDDGMEGLGYLTGEEGLSEALDVSDDGSVVVGRDNSDFDISYDYKEFRWTSDGGMEDIGALAGGGFESVAFGVSDDGSTVVGVSNYEAFRWTSDGGMIGLGGLAGGILLIAVPTASLAMGRPWSALAL